MKILITAILLSIILTMGCKYKYNGGHQLSAWELYKTVGDTLISSAQVKGDSVIIYRSKFQLPKMREDMMVVASGWAIGEFIPMDRLIIVHGHQYIETASSYEKIDTICSTQKSVAYKYSQTSK